MHTTRAKPLIELLAALLTACNGSSGPTVPSPGTEPLPPAFVPSAVALPNIPAREFVATSFGAIPNDGRDDTAALQAALDAVNVAGGGTLVVPAGRFDISINPATGRALTIYPRLRLAGRPAGQATLRVADAQMVYESVMAPATYPTRLDDFELVGITIDGNGRNNPVRNADETNGDLLDDTRTLRIALRSFRGSRARVADCTFTDFDNGNTISFNGAEVTDVVIERNRFLNAGGVLIDHDHSSIYTDGIRVRIADNQFRSRNGVGTLGARTAIESHGDEHEVRGNDIAGFLQGANLVGIVGAPARQRYARNTIAGAAIGLNIWPLAGMAPANAPPAFITLALDSNEIRLDPDGWWPSPAMVADAPSGIRFEPGVANGRLLRLEMRSNQITFATFGGRAADVDRLSVGISLRGVEPRLAIEYLDISDNTIRDAIGPGILSVAIVGGTVASRIVGNTLTDVGRGRTLIGVGDVLRVGMAIGGATKNLTISGNTVTAGMSPITTLTGFLLASTCSVTCAVGPNTTTGVERAVNITGQGWTVVPQ